MISDEAYERLCLDVDLRLPRELWHLVFETNELKAWDLAIVGQFVRAAYVAGYKDALTEDVTARLYRDHGYRAPTKEGK